MRSAKDRDSPPTTPVARSRPAPPSSSSSHHQYHSSSSASSSSGVRSSARSSSSGGHKHAVPCAWAVLVPVAFCLFGLLLAPVFLLATFDPASAQLHPHAHHHTHLRRHALGGIHRAHFVAPQTLHRSHDEAPPALLAEIVTHAALAADENADTRAAAAQLPFVDFAAELGEDDLATATSKVQAGADADADAGAAVHAEGSGGPSEALRELAALHSELHVPTFLAGEHLPVRFVSALSFFDYIQSISRFVEFMPLISCKKLLRVFTGPCARPLADGARVAAAGRAHTGAAAIRDRAVPQLSRPGKEGVTIAV